MYFCLQQRKNSILIHNQFMLVNQYLYIFISLLIIAQYLIMDLALFVQFQLFRFVINQMQSQDLLLLQILKLPVIVIKFLARVFSILTYLPNYAVLFLIDSVLFHEHLQSTFFMYALTWLPKVILLAAAVGLFVGQFYIIFQVMQLHQHGLVIQIVGMILTLAGLLILMRKGYLQLLKKYNLTKLKSPMEHVQLGLVYLTDLVGIILWIINAALVINIGRSWDYQYDPSIKYQFIKHIFNLIRDSLISYIEFFYVKIFFWLFPWRFNRQINTYKKEKDQKNVLNCLVLLTLIYLMTILDIITIILFSLPCIIHIQRKSYLNKLSQNYQKYKITLKQFGFVLLHSVQLVILIICTIFCWTNGGKALTKWYKFEKTDELFDSQFRGLIIQTILKIPYLLATLIIILSIYKYKRRNILRQKSKIKILSSDNTDKQIQKDSNENIWITFKCLAELLWDMCFIIFILFSTIIKPWNIWWLKYLLNNEYFMNHQLITSYFFKNIWEIFIIPFAIVESFLIFLYDFKRPYQLYQEAGIQIQNQCKQHDSAAPDIEKYKRTYLQSKSQIIKYFFKAFVGLKSDIPHLPLFYLAKMTFLNVYYPHIKPQTTPNLFIQLQRSYFYLSAKRSIRFTEYEEMLRRIKASGGSASTKEEYRFWKYAYKSQRLMLIQKTLSFLLPKRSVQKIKSKIEKGSEFSQIANHYWYNYEITKAMVIRLIYLIIQIILSLIGILFLFPLTLWRIPTFIKLILYHKSRKFFFPILSRIYIQMLKDVIILPVKIISFLMAPKMYISYIIKTSFKYGPVGIETFEIYQKCKHNFLMKNIFKASLMCLLLHCEIAFIMFFWIRIKNVKTLLRTERLTLSSLYTDVILKSSGVPTMQSMITEAHQQNYQKLNRIGLMVVNVFQESLRDLPYLLLMLFIFVTMPWRINYIIQTIKDMREDSTSRKSFFKLLNNIFKDYACIFMNILLLLSGFKTRKALFLIRRNYRLNFFIGFLEYSYFQELKNQLISLAIIYKNLFFLTMAVLFGWTRTDTLITDLQLLKKKRKQQQESAELNNKLYQNTVKSGKELQTIHKMGYYNYIAVCSFLTIPQIMKLRQVDQFNYMMTQRQEIWFTKWEYVYSKISNEIADSFEVKCKNAFIRERSLHGGEMVTYEHIIMRHFYINVFDERVDLADYLRQKIPMKYYDMVFKNYRYEVHEGYGPQNELPQQQNQDEQFLRLTNQVRRPKVYLSEIEAWLHLLYVRLIEPVAQKLHFYFRQDNNRRTKQLIFILLLGFILVSYLAFIWIFRGQIFCIDSLIGLKITLAIYYHSFMHFLLGRCWILLPQWVSLDPFDLYYDFIRVKNYLVNQVKNKIIIPTKNMMIKVGRFISSVAKKIYLKLAQIAKNIYQKLKNGAQKVKFGAEKVKDMTIKYSILAYEKVVKPLYISIADKIRKLKDFIVMVFTAVFKSMKVMFVFFGKIITSFYQAVLGIFQHINGLYFFILKSSMTYLLKFGLLGNLAFTLFGLIVMTLPSLIWIFIYRERWYLIVSTIHTMVLIVIGYKHLNKIKNDNK